LAYYNNITFVYVFNKKEKVKQLLILFTFIPFLTNAQLVFDKKKHDYGQITAYSNRVVDFKVTNRSNEEVHVFNSRSARNTDVLFSTKNILPDSSAFIRVKYTPQNEGRFSSRVAVFFSSQLDPVMLTLKGEVKEMPDDMELACPTFDEPRNKNDLNSFLLTIRVIDSITREPIRNARVKMISNGQQQSFSTNRSGLVQERVPLGLYFFKFSADNGYSREAFEQYVNRRRNRIEVDLVRKRQQPEPVEEVFVEVPEPVEEQPVVEEPVVEEVEEVIPFEEVVETEFEPEPVPQIIPEPVEEVVSDYSDLTDVPEKDFSEKNFKASNIVFLVDASGSMRGMRKMELLKTSMYKLLEMLRGIDRVALVSYSSEAKIIMESIPASRKESIRRKIHELGPEGYTAGGKGIKMAYELAAKNYIEGGNNQVIIATDGAFNRGSENYKALAKRYAKEGITMSVVAIRAKPSDNDNMMELSDRGDGRFIFILDDEDAQESLVDEIRTASFRGNPQ